MGLWRKVVVEVYAIHALDLTVHLRTSKAFGRLTCCSHTATSNVHTGYFFFSNPSEPRWGAWRWDGTCR
jgi:hypothetical protein